MLPYTSSVPMLVFVLCALFMSFTSTHISAPGSMLLQRGAFCSPHCGRKQRTRGPSVSQCPPRIPACSAGLARSTVQHRYRSREALRVQAIGFDFGDSERESRRSTPSPKVFGSFGLRAASLLLYGHVFKGAVGEAFLGLITASQKYQASNKDIVAAYTRLYQLLVTAGYESWQDYVLDQVLLGRDNPFARAVAQGNVSDHSPMLEAVAYDLDTLQSMAVGLKELAEFVSEVAPTVSKYWTTAAAASRLLPESRQLPLGSTGGTAEGIALPQPRSSSPGGGKSASGGSDFIARPCTEEELGEWKAAISGYSSWGQAAPVLKEYYHKYGFGITSRNATLTWDKGAFAAASEGALTSFSTSNNPATASAPPAAAILGPGPGSTVLDVLAPKYKALAANTMRHCQGLPAEHALVCGPPGSGKSWLLWEGTLLAGRDAGLRLVEVPPSEASNLLAIAQGCGRYPRVRFILVLDHVDLPLGKGALLNDLLAGLGNTGGNGWPSNCLLYIGVTSTSSVSRADPIAARCPLVVSLPEINEEQYFQVVAQLLTAAQQQASVKSAAAATQELSADMRDVALAWAAKPACGYSIRSAANFVRLTKS